MWFPYDKRYIFSIMGEKVLLLAVLVFAVSGMSLTHQQLPVEDFESGEYTVVLGGGDADISGMTVTIDGETMTIHACADLTTTYVRRVDWSFTSSSEWEVSGGGCSEEETANDKIIQELVNNATMSTMFLPEVDLMDIQGHTMLKLHEQ